MQEILNIFRHADAQEQNLKKISKIFRRADTQVNSPRKFFENTIF